MRPRRRPLGFKLLGGPLLFPGRGPAERTPSRGAAAKCSAGHQPGVVLLDLNPPNVDGLRVLGRMCAGERRHPWRAVDLILSSGAGEYWEKLRGMV